MRVLFLSFRRLAMPSVAVGASWLVFTSGGCSSPSSTSAPSSVCGDVFELAYGPTCDPTRPASEVARDRSRYLTLCEAELTLPGVGISSAQLESCANALRSSGNCLLSGNASTPTECQSLNWGTLASGAACSSGSQCESGNCNTASDAGLVGTSQCGSCTAPIALGGVCGADAGAGNAGFGCAMASACNAISMTCQVITYGDVGATCGTNVAACGDGLYCDPTTELCTTPKPSGSACGMGQECASPLVCLAATNTCGSPGGNGASCESAGDCAPGFDCGPMSQCVAISYAAAGQPCGGAVHCLVGSCAGNGSSNVCPTIIPDGQSCTVGSTSSATTCDIFANCMNGVCTLVPPTCH
jgi:hypothetical protein